MGTSLSSLSGSPVHPICVSGVGQGVGGPRMRISFGAMNLQCMLMGHNNDINNNR